MIASVFGYTNLPLLAGLASLFSILLTFFLLSKTSRFLPTDRGRAYASQSEASKGKPTGAGIIFVAVYVFCSLLFLPMTLDIIYFFSIVFITMLFGFLDDRAKKPWHEYTKGLLDLMVSFSASLLFSLTMGTDILMPLLGLSITLPIWLYVIAGTILIWISINVTNCTDGVDGLSSSLTIISVISFLLLSYLVGSSGDWNYYLSILVFVLLAYLWFNTNPSRLLMGDAGSRALGVILALAAMHTKSPFSFLAICLIFVLDGGAGIAKITLKRFLGINILGRIRTPLHDHFRERYGADEENKYNWKNQTVTVRFSLIHILVCFLYLLAVYCIVSI